MHHRMNIAQIIITTIKKKAADMAVTVIIVVLPSAMHRAICFAIHTSNYIMYRHKHLITLNANGGCHKYPVTICLLVVTTYMTKYELLQTKASTL